MALRDILNVIWASPAAPTPAAPDKTPLPKKVEIDYDGSRLHLRPRISGVEKKLFLSGEYEPDVRSMIKQTLVPGDVAVDIGAHIGHHTATMLQRVGPSGRIFALEPAPDRFAMITRNFGNRSNVQILQVGASDEDSKALLSDTPRRSPFVSSTPTDHTIEIRTITIATLMKEKSVQTIDLIKIDIEGHECKAIMGAAPCIDSIRNIIVEIHTDFIRDRYGEKSLDAMIDVLSSFPQVFDLKHSQTVVDAADKIRSRRRPQFLFSR